MKQITSRNQLQDLKIGSILLCHAAQPTDIANHLADLDKFTEFLVSGYTPIGWEDIELELQPYRDITRATLEKQAKAETHDTVATIPINVLGSEMIKDHMWWTE